MSLRRFCPTSEWNGSQFTISMECRSNVASIEFCVTWMFDANIFPWRKRRQEPGCKGWIFSTVALDDSWENCTHDNLPFECEGFRIIRRNQCHIIYNSSENIFSSRARVRIVFGRGKKNWSQAKECNIRKIPRKRMRINSRDAEKMPSKTSPSHSSSLGPGRAVNSESNLGKTQANQ